MKTIFSFTFYFYVLIQTAKILCQCDPLKKRIGLGSVETGLDRGEVDVCEVHLGGDQPTGGQLVSSSIIGD